MTVIADPNAESRSIMLNKPCVCDGEASGVKCVHFWSLIQRFNAQNADTVRDGDKRYGCKHVPGWFLEFTDVEKPNDCDAYEPRKAPGLVNIVRRVLNREPQAGRVGARTRVKSTSGFMPYDPDFSDFRPMTPEEIQQNREKNPDKPVQWAHGMDPTRMTLKDIADAEPINMLKPGEQIPGSLSPDTARAVADLFKDPDEKK